MGFLYAICEVRVLGNMSFDFMSYFVIYFSVYDVRAKTSSISFRFAHLPDFVHSVEGLYGFEVCAPQIA